MKPRTMMLAGLKVVGNPKVPDSRAIWTLKGRVVHTSSDINVVGNSPGAPSHADGVQVSANVYNEILRILAR